MIQKERCWWFGCWLSAGHHLVDYRGRSARGECPFYGLDHLLDGGYAPRIVTRGRRMPVATHDDGLCFQNMGREGTEEPREIHYASEECPQGQFLFHRARGCTLISWWDRTQGDTRGACNSTFIAEGYHTVDEILAAFPEVFPQQAKRLADAGVRLVCVNKGGVQ